jgi:hypothetical protein
MRGKWVFLAGVVATSAVGCGTPLGRTVHLPWQTQQVQTMGLQQAAFGAISRAQGNLQAAHDAAVAGKASEVVKYLEFVRRDLDQSDFAAAFPQKTTVVPEFIGKIDLALDQLQRATMGNWMAADSMDFLVKDIVAPLQKALTSTQLQLMR